MDEMHVVELPWGGLPYRAVQGDVRYPVDVDPDGDPLVMLLDSPDDPTAVELCGGEVRWWSVCQAIRMADLPGAWEPPAGITLSLTENGEWQTTTPTGRMLVRRTEPPRPAGLRARLRAVGAHLTRWPPQARCA